MPLKYNLGPVGDMQWLSYTFRMLVSILIMSKLVELIGGRKKPQNAILQY